MYPVLKSDALKVGRAAVYINIFGIVFSGLIFPVLTMLICPQPEWKNAELFISSFNHLQTATFFCGYFLVIGSLLTFVALTVMADDKRKIWAISALSVNILFTAIVFLNYIIQTTYVPYLATHNPPETSEILPVLTMADPGSLAWALEMYGWGGIGLSFIFMALIFGNNKYEKTLKILFLVNGISSVGSALMTSFNMKWLFSPAGLTALVIWNLLVLVIDLFLLKYFSDKQFEIDNNQH